MRQFATMVLLLSLGFCLNGSAVAGKATGSPEDTFKAAVAAMKREDVKGFASHLTKESQTAMSGALVFALGLGKAFAKFGKDGEAKVKAIDEVFNKHGVTEAVLDKLKDAFAGKEKDKKAIVIAMVALGGVVKDKPGFLNDAIRAMSKLDGKDPFKEIGSSTIKDIAIDGNTAKGQVTSTTAAGKEKTETFFFRVEDGTWKIDMIRMMEEKGLFGK